MKKYVTLGEVCTKGSSNIAQKDIEQNNGSYGIYGASGYIKDVDFYHQDKPYIAVVKDGAGIGRTMLLPEKTSVIGTMQYLIPNDDVCVEYLYYAVTYMNLAKYFSGATIPHIYFRDYQKEKLPLLTIEEQRKIADNLRKIDRLIELCGGILQKLDVLVKSRFVEMFGDIIRNTKQWDIYIFSDITTSRLGKMLDAKKQTGENAFPYLANFNVQWFRFELDNLNTMDFDAKDQAEFSLEEDDLLVCEGGEIGRCAIWHNEVSPCYFQKALHRVRCNKEIIMPTYLAWWFRFNCDNNGFSEIEGAKATIAHLPGAKLKKLPVVVPPLALQEQFAAFVEQTDKSKFIAINIKKIIRRVRLNDQF